MHLRESLSEESDWFRYTRTHDPAARDRLITRYMPLVERRARRLIRRLPHSVSYDELCSAGYEGLIRAVEAYRPGLGASFETFSAKRILGAMLDWLRGLDPMARTTRQFKKRIEQIRSEMSAATDAEIASRLGMTSQRFDTLARRARERSEVLFATCCDDVERTCVDEVVHDPVDDTQPDPSERIAHELMLQRIRREVDATAWEVIRMYYFEYRTMREIGSALGMSESRVSQIHSAVIRRLRDVFGIQTSCAA